MNAAFQSLDLPTLYPADLFMVGIAGFLLAVAILMIAALIGPDDREPEDKDEERAPLEFASRSTTDLAGRPGRRP